MNTNFRNLIDDAPRLTTGDLRRVKTICATVPGYSGDAHYAVFKHLLRRTEISDVLILGVYFGRDISFLLDLANTLGRKICITGVDKFSDDECADWPRDKRSLSWEEAGFGRAPSRGAALANIERFGQATLIEERDELFLPKCTRSFDAVYLDTSHDYETVCRQIGQATQLLTPGGLLMGDDYSDQGTWGVKRAVREKAPHHIVYCDWIWVADGDALRCDAGEQAGRYSIKENIERYLRRSLFRIRGKGKIKMEEESRS